MTLDARFIIASDLQSLFRDKDTGLPLSAGIVTFYRDASRITKKPVYQITGNPPDYTYAELPNPIVLTAAGTFSDGSGHDIVPYYFPYVGTPDDDSTVIDLYYVTVESSGSVDQFDRVAWPNFDPNAINAGENIENFIPNGQFLIHNDIPADPNATPATVAGQITAPITQIAQGGWTFERPNASAATDIVTFPPFSSYVTAPTFSPRFKLNVQTTVFAGGDAFKYIGIKFFDVNKFASDSQHYNFYFEAESAGSAFPVDIRVIKYFGTGGSATTTGGVSTVTIPSSFGEINVPILFGDNSGKTIGPGSYVQIVIALPINAVYNATFDNFALTFGSASLAAFPAQTDTDMMVRSTYGFTDIPAPDGSDLYLSPVLTKAGMQFDTSVIGNVVTESNIAAYTNSISDDTNRLLADGSRYLVSDRSGLGIPYSRLFNKYWNAGIKNTLYGTGPDYFTCLQSQDFGGPATEMLIYNNNPGSVSNTVDGTTATGFGLLTIHTGNITQATAYIVPTGGVGVGQFYVQNLTAGAVNAPTIGTATNFTLVGKIQTGTALVPQIVGFIAPDASMIAGGQYIQISTGDSGTPALNFLLWFKVGGAGSAPVVSGYTAVELVLNTADSATIVAEKIVEAMRGAQQTAVTVLAGSVIPAGAYFRVFSTAVSYSIWYKVNGVGAAPNVSDFEIPVSILSTDTVAQVMAKTQLAMNGYCFAVPDYRGLFLRGTGSENDPDAAFRFSVTPQVAGDQVGTSQLSQNIDHLHSTLYKNGSNGNAGAGVPVYGSPPDNTGNAGGRQANPNNTSVNFAIIY